MDQELRREPFIFTGRGGEYFRIWIVNLCLSLLTLGIYFLLAQAISMAMRTLERRLNRGLARGRM